MIIPNQQEIQRVRDTCPPGSDLYAYAAEQWKCLRETAKNILFWSTYSRPGTALRSSAPRPSARET